jgi:outer membrane receptor protein involved in Fe transport
MQTHSSARQFLFRPTLLALAAAAAAASAPALAQQAPAEGASTTPLETIVVTTRKRAEASQTVPVAVSAFSAEASSGPRSPGRPICSSQSQRRMTGNDRFTIRGIGNNSLGGDNGVASRSTAPRSASSRRTSCSTWSASKCCAVPQGTLFGRNTTGGALSIFTKRPTDKLQGKLAVELGNYNHRRVEGMINIPISDNLRQRFAGYVLKRDGFTKNEFTGNRIDGRDQYSIRSSTRVFAGERTEANLVLGLYDEDSSRTRESKRQCKAIAVLGCSPNELGSDSPNYASTVFAPLANFFLVPAGIMAPGSNIYTGAPNPESVRAVAADYDAKFRLNNKYATLDVTHDFGPVSLTLVSGYSKSDTEQNTDWDNSALPFRFNSPQTYSLSRNEVVTTDRLLTTDSFTAKNRTHSHELRLASQNKGAFNYTTGLFLYDSVGSGGFFIWHPIFELSQKLRGRPAETWFINGETLAATTKAKAWFGEGQLKIGENTRPHWARAGRARHATPVAQPGAGATATPVSCSGRR